MNTSIHSDHAMQHPASTRSRRAGRTLRALAGGAGVAAVVVTGILAGSGGANASSLDISARPVYEAKIVNQHVVLGGSAAPTTLVTSPALPGGTYQLSAIVGGTIFPHDQIVCAALRPGQNDGVFGTAGNPADGTAGIYATAPIDDTVTVASGQRIALTCNAFNAGRGTFASEAVLELRPAAVYH